MEGRNGQDLSEIPKPASHLLISCFTPGVVGNGGRGVNLDEKDGMTMELDNKDREEVDAFLNAQRRMLELWRNFIWTIDRKQ
jgi:hypothetical protein